jgi:hypothetical protein
MSVLATFALRKAVKAALSIRPELLAELGGARIFDEAPRGTAPPYVTFGDGQWRDWSTATERGGQQTLTLDVWTDHRGTRKALAIAERIATALDGAALTLEGHRLIDLRLDAMETRREGAGRLARATLRFRATTETI